VAPLPATEATQAPAASETASPTSGAPAAETAEHVLRDGASGSYEAAPWDDGATLALLIEQWPRARKMVGAQSKNLEALLNSCAPAAVDGATVSLSCPEWHAGQIQKPDNKRLVEDALSQVAGQPCYVKCVVREKKTDAPAMTGPDTAKPDENDPLVRAALRMLNARGVLENN